jgi:zinc protease
LPAENCEVDAPVSTNGASERIERFTLENGLRLVTAPAATGQVAAVNLWYGVGSRHEVPGRTGFAHLFEHLMFEGSANVEKNEHFRLIEHLGGEINASTSNDRTNYFETVPVHALDLALWLEADRLATLREGVTQEVLDNQRAVVKNERRQRYDNMPYGTALERILSLGYPEGHPYHHPTIGSMEDLDAAELEDVHSFFDTYYAPNNATLTVVGAFEPELARQLIEQYFGGIAPGLTPAAPSCTDPFRDLPVRREIGDANAHLPAVFLSYGTVEVGHADSYALDLLGAILGAGETSRLHRRLVREERAALQASAVSTPRRDPGLFLVIVIANQGVEAERLQTLIDEEIDRVQREGVTEEELQRAQNRARASAVMGRQTVMGRAETLQWHNHFLGDPGAYRTEMERMLAVTADEVRDVARRYLTEANRAVVITRPGTEVTP